MNPQKLIVLEDRLNILDKLEALSENNPYAKSYVIGMAELRLTGSPDSAKNHFEALQAQRVAVFRFDHGIPDALFWHAPLRVEKINAGEVARMQQQTKGQLSQLDPGYFQPNPDLLPASRESTNTRIRKFFRANKRMISIIVGLAAFLASVAIIWAFVQGQHW